MASENIVQISADNWTSEVLEATTPVLLVGPRLRYPLRQLCAQDFPKLTWLSTAEMGHE